ncbi:MAG TPA: shikimate kinase [Pyrinomonadaceae bacterium]|jgi:shikimate kinase|nr:shikimate kinase [Pyrinomonadaceae bacterium]
MNDPERILITGFMGAGKTTAGAALARLLGCSMIDMDRLIAEREGLSCRTIIEEEGEARFRAAEERALSEALENKMARVIALGGGAWANPRNRALISEHKGLTVWLDAPFELCWRRIRRMGDTRPLARRRESARLLYEARRASYELAPLRVSVAEGDDADKVAIEIIKAIGERAQ